MRHETSEGNFAFIQDYTELESAVYAALPGATYEDVNAVMLQLAAELFTNNRPLLYKAISAALYKAPEDCSNELDDYLQDVFLHLLQKPEKLIGLLFPKKAKRSTVLFALVSSRMRAVRSKLIGRHRLASERLADFALSGLEIAEPEPDEQKLEEMAAA